MCYMTNEHLCLCTHIYVEVGDMPEAQVVGKAPVPLHESIETSGSICQIDL